MPRTHRLVAAAVVALALGACTTEDPETTERLDALEDQVADLGTDDDPFGDVTSDEEACLETAAPGLDVRAVLTDGGRSGVDERVRMTNAMIGCLPDLAENDAFVDQLRTNIDTALGGADLDLEEGRCLLRHILDESPDPGRTLADGSDPADGAVFLGGAEACFDETSLGVLFRSEGSGPQAYGDDPRLDALADDCESGDDDACDLLYIQSSVGSEYEALAGDCAGRGSGLEPCAGDLVAEPSGGIDPASPGFDRLREECALGDMTSCDLLYRTAPVGSDDEQYGFTCGDRIAVGALPDCRTRFDD